MANVLALALKINADSTGLTNNLGKAERAFLTLQGQAARLTSIFDEFAGSSEAAATAQAETAAALDDLLARVQRGEVTAKEFAEQFAAIGIAARDEADALREAARITEANLSPLERFTREQEKLKAQLDAGRISQETFNRAVASAAKPLSDAERAAVGFVDAADDIEGATEGFGDFGKLVVSLPGPLGSLSGKINEFAGVGRQLSAVFSGGLSSGLSQLGSAALGLVNPFTLAAAGVVAFTQAAQAVTAGLINLENRVEALGNQAFQLGVSFEFVQVIEESARRSGTSVDALRGATTRLQQQLVEAGKGSSQATDAIAGLGLSIEELQSLGPDEQFRAIARAITEIEDPAERTAAATRLFGEAGVQLLPFFRNLEGAAQDIEKVGRVLSDAQREDIDAFGRSMDRLGVATQSASQQLTAEFAPAATRTANTLSFLAGGIARNADTITSAVATSYNLVIPGSVTLLNGLNDAVERTQQGADAANAAADGTKEAFSRSAEEVNALSGAFQSSQQALDEVIAKAGEFGQAGFDAAFEFQQALAELEKQALEGELNAEQYARGVANATVEFEKQIDVARQVAEENRRIAQEAQRQADSITRRVDGLLAKANEIPRVEQELNAVQAEIDRVEAELASAREAGATAQADALAGRLAQLDQLQATLQDQADEAAQGFSGGFDKAFESVDRGINSLIDKASEFGNAGAEAAVALQDGIEEAQQQVRDGILTKEAFDAEVERQKELFNERVSQLQQAERIAEQIADKEAGLLDRQFEIELARAEELANVRSGSIEINDLREGGISAFFDTLQEDPAIAEARKQTAELERVRREIA